MPIKHAAFKAMRQAEKRRERNMAAKHKMKKAIKLVRKSIAAGQADKAQEALPAAIRIIDRTRQKGVIKKNTASRLKSRLSKAVRKIST